MGWMLWGLSVARYPQSRDLATRLNLEELPHVTGVPLLGCIPAGAGAMNQEQFCSQVRLNPVPLLPPVP